MVNRSTPTAGGCFEMQLCASLGSSVKNRQSRKEGWRSQSHLGCVSASPSDSDSARKPLSTSLAQSGWCACNGGIRRPSSTMLSRLPGSSWPRFPGSWTSCDTQAIRCLCDVGQICRCRVEFGASAPAPAESMPRCISPCHCRAVTV